MRIDIQSKPCNGKRDNDIQKIPNRIKWSWDKNGTSHANFACCCIEVEKWKWPLLFLPTVDWWDKALNTWWWWWKWRWQRRLIYSYVVKFHILICSAYSNQWESAAGLIEEIKGPALAISNPVIKQSYWPTKTLNNHTKCQNWLESLKSLHNSKFIALIWGDLVS